MAMKRLRLEYKAICKDVNTFYSIKPSDDDFLKWEFIMIGPPDTIYEGGMFTGYLSFPQNYPISPPQVYFNKMIHPNVYDSGMVCISILHEGVDSWWYEKSFERWTPSHIVDSIMTSIISMLSDPNFESPANMNYSVMWKDKPDEYRAMVYRLVAQSQ